MEAVRSSQSGLLWTLRRAQPHGKPHWFLIAECVKMNACPRSHGENSLVEFARGFQRYSVDPGDHIARTDFRSRGRAARLRLLKNRAMGYGHAETDSDRLVYRADLQADPPTMHVGLRSADEGERCPTENVN